MYFKLAFRNVKKSYKDFVIYFMTLTFSVALFYVFNSFHSQSIILDLDPESSYMIETLVRTMGVMSVIVSIIFGFLILYANNFLIKRRKKELGMYTLLGMPKQKITLVLIYETILIGIASLISGIVLGILLSQLTAALSARLIEVPVVFKFVFSSSSVLITALSFSFIFMITATFNTFVISRHKLINLLKAERINENTKLKNNWVILLITFISISSLSVAYYLALDNNIFINFLYPIVILGTVSTFGVFYSLSAIIMKLPKRFTKFYYKDLNTFVFRQIGAKINSTYKMMAVVSLMLLVGIGALATSFNINSILGDEFNTENPYDLTLGVTASDRDIASDIIYEIDLAEITYKSVTKVNIYHSGISLSDLSEQISSKRPTNKMDLDFEVAIVPLDQYNSLRKEQNLDQIQLENSEIVYFSSIPLEKLGQVSGYADTSYQFKDKLTFADQIFKVKDSRNHNDYKVSLMNNISFQRFFLIMNDNDLEKVKINRQEAERLNDSVIFNFDFYTNQDRTSQYDIVDKMITIINNPNYSNMLNTNIDLKLNAADSVRESTLLFTYVGLYLGAVFIISSAVVLSLQLLSEASDNQSRYRMLSKIGVSNKMARKSVFKQNAIYFFIPMFVALVHSWVGIKAVNQVLTADLGYINNDKIILSITAIVIFVYILYFFFTFRSSINIIEENNKDNVL